MPELGVLNGVVTNVADPLNAGRVRFLCPVALGLLESEWAEPVMVTYAPPLVGAAIFVSFADGDLRKPVWFGGGTPRLDQVGAPTANVSMNNHKLTGLAAGTASSTDAARMIDVAGRMPLLPTELGGGIDLNTVITAGVWTQSQNAEAATGSNYPVAAAGLLEVEYNVTGAMVWQRYTTYQGAGNNVYVRAYYSLGTGWSAWQQLQFTDPELTALAALVSAADQLPYFTGSGTAALATLTAFARTLLDDTTQAAMQATLGLVPGTNVQAQDADLQAIAALAATAGLLARTGAGTFAVRTLTGTGLADVTGGNGATNPNVDVSDSTTVTTGFTASAGWTLNTQSYRLIGGLIAFLHVQLTRTGATITGPANGNIGNTALLDTIPAAVVPNRDMRFMYAVGSASCGSASIAAANQVQLESLLPTATISAGDVVTLDCSYFVTS